MMEHPFFQMIRPDTRSSLTRTVEQYTRGFTDAEKMEFDLIVNFSIHSLQPSMPTLLGLSVIMHDAYIRMMEIKKRREKNNG